MAKRKRKKYPTGPWTERITALMRGCGWTLAQVGEKLGVSSYVVTSVLRGRIPKVDMLVRLAKLEGVYAGEIEAYHKGLIGLVPGRKMWIGCSRFDFTRPGLTARGPLNAMGTGQRPADIAEVGVLGASRPDRTRAADAGLRDRSLSKGSH